MSTAPGRIMGKPSVKALRRGFREELPTLRPERLHRLQMPPVNCEIIHVEGAACNVPLRARRPVSESAFPYVPWWLDSSAAKIPRSLRPKKNPGNRGTEQPVNGKFRESAKGTQNYVECNPGEGNPTRPVVAPKHKCSTDNRNKFDELH